jgi:protein-tyrosine-phosphatase
LRVVDALLHSDRTFQELAAIAGLPGNAAAHHLAVLDDAGLIERQISEGDRRRRYLHLRHERLADLVELPHLAPRVVLFICTHNSARSQFAAALWSQQTGGLADSAGNRPADQVHPIAVRAAAKLGVDLSTAVPKGYDAVLRAPDLVVSVCDRAREAGLPFEAPSLHWSVPDPVRAGTPAAFRSAFADIASRIDHLATTPFTPTSP